MFSEGIWKRTGQNELSQAAYIRTIAFATLVVALIVAGGSAVSYTWEPSWFLIIGSFIASVVCILIFQGSDNPSVSFLGVSGMSLALGLMIGPFVALYNADVVIYAVATTGAIMVTMSLAGIFFPQVFEGMGPYLLGGLILLLFASLATAFFFPNDKLLDTVLIWVGMAIFTFYVAYDWSRGLSLPYTTNNAIDVAGGLILDAVNLFIRLLQIYASAQGGGSRRK